MTSLARATSVWIVGGTLVASLTGCAEAPSRVSTPDGAPAAVSRVATTTGLAVGDTVYTAVAVATLWTSPSAPRALDAPAVANPVHISAWLAAMSTTQRLGLVGRVETQTLLGDALQVRKVRPHWLKVLAVRQPTSRNVHGYPGWVPRRQVTVNTPTRAVQVATVIQRLAVLRRADGTIALHVSFGTRLPVLRVGTARTTVATPTGTALTVANAAIVRTLPGARALPLTRRAVLDSARLFLGVPYLWGGRSGYAVDCSGFTSIVYMTHGVRIPRDADDQAVSGRYVSVGAERRADLLFYAGTSGAITHVAFYVGNGRRLQAPRTGEFVSTAPVGSVTAVRSYV
jgi:gamma-D-glutamyl-L-lysine dipeptidyl-peptidase